MGHGNSCFGVGQGKTRERDDIPLYTANLCTPVTPIVGQIALKSNRMSRLRQFPASLSHLARRSIGFLAVRLLEEFAQRDWVS
jgi:hypothetical protein